MKALIAIAFMAFTVVAAQAGGADVMDVKIQPDGQGGYRFDVSVRHDDTGWDHYANRWQVRSIDGTILGTRELAHPHVDEQPFTRSLSGVKIPPDIKTVIISAGDSVHGDTGKTMTVALPDR